MTVAPVPFENRVVSMSGQDVVKNSLKYLPATLIASTVGVKDPGQVRKWSNGSLNPTFDTLEKLRFLLVQSLSIEEAESSSVATSWLTSASSQLGYDLPIKAIREGRYREVSAAVSAFLHGYAG